MSKGDRMDGERFEDFIRRVHRVTLRRELVRTGIGALAVSALTALGLATLNVDEIGA